MKRSHPIDAGYVKLDDVAWQPFPENLSQGGIRWKLLHVSPEMGSWTAVFDCPKDSSFHQHIHMGPGEYLLTKGRMEVRGGDGKGGATAEAVSYGYEPCNARHDHTWFPEAGEFYMTFLGPLNFINDDGSTLALVSWVEAQELWLHQIGAA